MLCHVNTVGGSAVSFVVLLGMLIAASGFPALADAQQPEGYWQLKRGAPRTLQVALFKSQVLQLRTPAKKVSIGNPEIADILILRAQQLYVVGKALGNTNVVLWDDADRVITTINIEVTHDLDTLKAKLYQLLPNEDIKVYSSQAAIVLSGEVSSAVKMDAALTLARSFLPATRERNAGAGTKVLNLLQVGGAQQVMLEVKVAEIARTLMKSINADFFAIGEDGQWKAGAVSGGASFPDALFDPNDVRIPVFPIDPGPPFSSPIGPVVDEFLPNDLTIRNTGLFAHFLSGDTMFNVILEVAKEKGLAKILAEPTLTTLTGQEAKFISGGEFPIPVPDDDGITIEFKEFGIGLRFLPVVLDSGRINLKLNVSVSELTSANSVVLDLVGTSSTFFVPAITKRSASATVELSDGQTLGIAGLISESLRESVRKFPGLGSIPILGVLFRSQQFIKGQTELVIFVTPHFARPTLPELVRLPTDDFVEPTDVEFYLKGRIEGKRPKQAPQRLQEGGAEGSFGHEV